MTRPIRLQALAAAALAAALLAACQGGSEPETNGAAAGADRNEGRARALAAPANWVAIPSQPDALLQNLNVPADAPSKGMWSGSKPWPFNAIHSVLLSDGRLLTFGTPFGNPGAQDGRYFDIWSPGAGFVDSAHAGSITPDPVNSFCGMAGWLADGSLLVAGGNGGGGSPNYGKVVGTFSLDTYKTTTNALSMAAERWYATMVALPDGRQLVLGGTVPYASPITSQTPEIFENGAWRSLFGAASTPMFGVRQVDNQGESNPWYYPRAWVAPDGKVFGITSKYMFKLDPDANNRSGSITQVGTFKTVQDGSGATTPNVGFTSTAVMYAPGRILQVGGNGTTDNNGLQASLNASVIDINGAAPVVTETAPMSFRRHWANANVLPDGKVVVTGGTTVGWEPANAVRPAEIWNPATGTWTVGASAVETRTYHSSSVLLPNGTVFTAGGGAPGAVNNQNAEVYYPPYLFTTVNGVAQLAARPVITAMSALSGAYGGTLGIEMDSTAAVSRLVLIHTGTTTHSWNATQRYVPLTWTQSGSTVTANLPASANLAPPGYYMVFALNAAGVPSRGVMISLGGLKAPAATPPALPNALPANAIYCSAEYNNCTLPAGLRATVYYGANGIYVSRTGFTGTFACSNATFGDPVPVVKACHYVPEGPPNTTYCAAENGSCTVPAGYTGSVSYGANGTYVTLAGLTGSVACTTARFGSDPVPGVVKSCFLGPTTPVTAPAPALPSVAAPAIIAGGTASYAPAVSIAGATYVWTFGDGSPATAASASPNTTHAYTTAGLYTVKLTARLADGSAIEKTFLQAVTTPATARAPAASSALALETRTNASARLWVANPDTDTVAVIDTATNARVAEIAVGSSPRTVAVAPDGRVWVANKGSADISIVNPATLAVAATVALPRASQPHGLAFAPGGGSAYVVLEATGQLLKLDPASGATQATLAVGPNVRHVSLSADGATALVTRFITPALPGEATATINTTAAGAEVVAVNAGPMTLRTTVLLRHSDKTDTEAQGAGIPNYLGAAAISPDGGSAWVPSKQDNVKRGTLRNGQALTFQNTVRAISSRIDLATLAEDLPRRVDHDNSSLGSAAAYHPGGAYLFVALETSRQVALVDPVAGRELLKLDVGRAPQALAVSPDGRTLYVQNFMDRTVTAIDLAPLVTVGETTLRVSATVGTIGTEKLPAQVLQGKQLFHDARDPRLARDSYMSCASCHNDAGHDGRTWDFTGFGEGLRNTPALKGRAGTAQGFVHWSANFDEIQDFEGQIRNFAGGTGLMTDAQFNTGTRNTPLGDRKAGVSADLDALAAYLGSLGSFDNTPFRNADGTLSAAATAGKAVFAGAGCASCHGGAGFTGSGDATGLKNIGTIKPGSGQRLGAALTGIDVPTLRDAWKTGPYLHDGSAATLAAAVQAHNGNAVAGTDLANLVAYLQQIGAEEGGLAGSWSFNEGTGATAADGSGGNRSITLANTAWVTGKLGAGVQFNGATASGSTAGAVVDTSRSFSVATWVRLDALTGWRTMVNQDGANVSGFWLQYSEFVGSKFLLTMHDVDNTASTAYRAVGTTTPVTGQWYHVVGVRDKAAGTMKIYVNGRLEGTTAYAGGWVAGGTLNVGRGKFGGPGDWLAGAMDEVKVYGTVLSDADVAALYAQGNAVPPNAAPTVALTAPAASASVVQGAAVTISASAADSDGTVAKVEFYDGETLLATDTTAPYGVSWTAAGVGAHTLTAKATDNAGAVTTSAAVTLNVTAPPNVAPTVSLTAPANNTSVVQGTAVTIAASAADSDGSVAKVEFYDGATLLGTVTAPPYSLAWNNAAPGTHTLTARATDNAGAATTSAAVALTVTTPVPTGNGTGLTASYYGNANLTGNALVTRTEVPWFDWGTAAPAPGVPADNFSVRWSGQVQAMEAGTYQFRTNSDDGVRVWINGTLVISNWTMHGPTLDTSAGITLAAGQKAWIVIEHQDTGGGAVLQLGWLRPGGAWAPVPATQLYAGPAVGNGTGLTGRYYNNTTLTGTPVLTRVEAPWFDWGTGAPATAVRADNFSVRWTGQVQALEAGTYQFRTNSDDGVRVWVNGVQVINNWTVHAPTVDTSAGITLAAGQKVTITVEYQEFTGGAVLQLGWLRPGGAWAAVPATQLFP